MRPRLSHRRVLLWVLAPFVVLIIVNLLMLLAVYVECWALGEVTYLNRFSRSYHSCRFDGRFHFSK